MYTHKYKKKAPDVLASGCEEWIYFMKNVHFKKFAENILQS